MEPEKTLAQNGRSRLGLPTAVGVIFIATPFVVLTIWAQLDVRGPTEGEYNIMVYSFIVGCMFVIGAAFLKIGDWLDKKLQKFFNAKRP